MTERVNLKNVAVVLHRPRFPENIGAAVRAMRNMGIGRLLVVSPADFDQERILRLATHGAAKTVEQIQCYDSLAEALAPFQYVAGTTARRGGQRDRLLSPEDLARELVPIGENNRIALVFGPEDRGLTNEELRLCHRLVTIPTGNFSSLNLAQAVMVVCYELFKATLPEKPEFVPRMASRHELDGMYDGLRDLLVRISYINPENPDYWLHRIRQYFTRLRLRAKEVSIIRGLCRQVDWYAEKRYRDGLEEGQRQTAADEKDDVGR
jgi:tRNA/rRNA methyltransferase